MPYFAVGALENELVHDICMYNRTAVFRMIEQEKRNADRLRPQGRAVHSAPNSARLPSVRSPNMAI